MNRLWKIKFDASRKKKIGVDKVWDQKKNIAYIRRTCQCPQRKKITTERYRNKTTDIMNNAHTQFFWDWYKKKIDWQNLNEKLLQAYSSTETQCHSDTLRRLTSAGI